MEDSVSSVSGFQRFQDSFKGLDTRDPGTWPAAPRILLALAVLVAVVVVGALLFWRDKADMLEQYEEEEKTLRSAWFDKKKQSVNLDKYKLQLEETDRQFGVLLKQLPDRAEMESLLSDINQAALVRGLQIGFFKPGGYVIKEFHAELPSAIQVFGGYHEIGEFISDVVSMPRIVTFNDIKLSEAVPTNKNMGSGQLEFKAEVVTYRYLDDEETQERQKQKQRKKK